MVKNWSPGNGSQIDLIKNWYLEIGPKSDWSKTGLMETRMFKKPKEIGEKLVPVCRFGNGVKKNWSKTGTLLSGSKKTGHHMASYLRTPKKTGPVWTPWL